VRAGTRDGQRGTAPPVCGVRLSDWDRLSGLSLLQYCVHCPMCPLFNQLSARACQDLGARWFVGRGLMHRAIPGVCAIPGYPGIYGVGISQDIVGFNCVNTSIGPSVHHTSPRSTTCRVRERSNASPQTITLPPRAIWSQVRRGSPDAAIHGIHDTPVGIHVHIVQGWAQRSPEFSVASKLVLH
jgi:hypothetical protein